MSQDTLIVGDVVDPNDTDTITTVSLEEFYYLVVGWHNHAVKRLEALHDIKVGTTIVRDPTTMHVLTDESRKGFILGVTAGLSVFGSLPFSLPEGIPDVLH